MFIIQTLKNLEPNFWRQILWRHHSHLVYIVKLKMKHNASGEKKSNFFTFIKKYFV